MGIKIITKNKRSFYDYAIEETFEAGITLKGTEVKSLRLGKVSLQEAYATIDKNMEAWIYNITIPHYEYGNIHNHDETRKRKLLLNKSEIEHIAHEINASRMTLIPIKIYFKKSLVKIEIGLGRGKKQHDKRQDKAKKEVERKLKKGQYDI